VTRVEWIHNSAIVNILNLDLKPGNEIMNKRTILKRTLISCAVLSLSANLIIPSAFASDSGEKRRLFLTSAVEDTINDTVTLPLYRGTSNGKTVWFSVLDASTIASARQYGVNRARKLDNAKNTTAVQKVTIINGVIEFPATVDFTPERSVIPGPEGFPPLAVQPGAIGEPGYSPLIQLPNGTILNAPHMANDSGQADKVLNLTTNGNSGSVVFQETEGYANNSEVYYISTDASDFAAAALEGVTFAPQLNNAPFLGGDRLNSARSSLVAFTNGQTGENNPERQGLNSALLDGLDPINIIRWTPNQPRYSPLWDVHLTSWSAENVANGTNVMQVDFDDVEKLAGEGQVFSFGGGAFGPAGFIVNCPVISEEIEQTRNQSGNQNPVNIVKTKRLEVNTFIPR
jgi:hypothetical protein